MKVEIVSVTPAIAEQMLARTKINRTVKPRVVSRYAGAMRRGEWMGTGDPIQIDSHGNLANGQHRLHAIIESGTTQELLIVHDVDPMAQDAMDQGVVRNVADVLRFRGETSTSILGGTLRILFRWQSGWYLTPTRQQQLQLLEENPGLRNSVVTGAAVGRQVRLQPSSAAAMHYVLSSLDEEANADADAFFGQLMTGENLTPGSPILALRKALDKKSQRYHNDRRYSMALTIKAWNAYREGRQLEQLKWSPGGSRPEPFPTPV